MTTDVFDYLPILTPDYAAETLTIKPAGKIEPISDILQRSLSTDGGNPKTSTMKTTPDILLPLSFQGLTSAQKETIIDLYLDPNKALKGKRSFKWQHPTTDVVYVVKFEGTMSNPLYTYGVYDINVAIRVIGRVS